MADYFTKQHLTIAVLYFGKAIISCKRILLIDDDEQLMEVLASKLVEQRYAVDLAGNGEMGWEFVLLFDFDLVVVSRWLSILFDLSPLTNIPE